MSDLPKNRRRATRIGGLAIAAAAALALTAAAPGAAEAGVGSEHHGAGQQRVGYFTQWGIYSGFFEKNLVSDGTAAKLTDLTYAFSNVSPAGLCTSGDSWADYQRPFAATEAVNGVADAPGQALNGNFNQLKELKAAYPNLKIQMSIGGWSWSGHFSQLAETDAGRKAFVASCIDQYIKGDIPGLAPGAAAGIFDGIDVDWEYPNEVGAGNPHGPQDTVDFTLLMKEFRTELDALGQQTHQHYLLTAPTPAGLGNAAQIQLGKVAHIADWLNLETFDYHGGWEPTGPTDFSANLYGAPNDPAPPALQINSDEVVHYYLAHGVPAHKLVLAIPFYAHVWTGVAPGPNGDGLYQPATAAGGTPNYNQVVTAAGVVHHDPVTGSTYKYDPASQTFYTYDDPTSIQIKMRYVNRMGLLGAWFWSADGDDAQGSLVTAIYDGLRHCD